MPSESIWFTVTGRFFWPLREAVFVLDKDFPNPVDFLFLKCKTGNNFLHINNPIASHALKQHYVTILPSNTSVKIILMVHCLVIGYRENSVCASPSLLPSCLYLHYVTLVGG